MAIQTISPQTAQDLVNDGALLIDIRSINEHHAEHIANSINQPIDQFDSDLLTKEQATKIIFYCRSGMRTKLNTEKLASVVGKELYILKGGINGWKKASLPTIKGAKQTMDINRQLHIIIGTLIILGTVLGFSVSVWFYLLPLFLGYGLVFSGFTGFCALQCLLSKMPWNHIKCNR